MPVNTQAPAVGSTTQTYLAQGNAAMRAGNYLSAIEFFEQALQQSPALADFINFNLLLAKSKFENEISIIKSNKEFSSPEQKELSSMPVIDEKKSCIDIVVPVFNALKDVQRCLNALERWTDGFTVKVFVVNDFSNEETTSWLRQFCRKRQMFSLIENRSNLGYTKTVNIGLKATTAKFAITLNSDTIVTKGWLDSLISCFNDDPKIGIAGPLSNAATWQNVPDLRNDSGEFAVNDIPNGLALNSFAELVKKSSYCVRPQVPFLNGFCFVISRAVINSIGLMDEENFPIGYGEENDYCIRALNAGFKLVVADDSYVFHSKSKSFGHTNRKELSNKGTQNLIKKHGKEFFLRLVNEIKEKKEFEFIRANIKRAVTDIENVDDVFNFSVLFLLPGGGGGGGSHSVVQEVNAMRDLGVNAKIAINDIHYEQFLTAYSDIENIEEALIRATDEQIIEEGVKFDVVVATYFTTVKVVKKICELNSKILPAYYVQDYEPWFCPDGSKIQTEALDSYNLIDEMVRFAKTDWIADKVFENHRVVVNRVKASIDHSVYKPSFEKKSENFVVTAMIRPQTPRRGAERTMLVLKDLKKLFLDRVVIKIFGTAQTDSLLDKLETDFEFENLGVLKRKEVADLLKTSTIFIDLSDYQAFGRTGLEAMASGCVPILPSVGGVYEYAVSGQNSVIVDVYDHKNIIYSVSEILNKKDYLLHLKISALTTASQFTVRNAALSELRLFSKILNERSYNKIDNEPHVSESVNLTLLKRSSDRKFTIGIPTYNRPNELKNLLNSIFNSGDFTDDTCVLVSDDGSFSETEKIIKEFSDAFGIEKLRYIKNKKNLGYALNYANLIKECDTEFIMIVADDNVVEMKNFIRAKDFCLTNTFDFITSPWLEGGKVGHRAWKGHKTGLLPKHDFFNSADHAPGLIYRTSVVKSFISELIERISKKCHFSAVFPQVLIVLNILANGGKGYYLDYHLGSETSVLPSGIKDPSGNNWRTYESLILQASDINKYINEKTWSDKVEFSQASKIYYIRYIVKVLEPSVRSKI